MLVWEAQKLLDKDIGMRAIASSVDKIMSDLEFKRIQKRAEALLIENDPEYKNIQVRVEPHDKLVTLTAEWRESPSNGEKTPSLTKLDDLIS